MISDGIENCVQYVLNFDAEKSKNPFAYFTQVIYYAFLRRIEKEKKQLEIKNKILEKTGFSEVFCDDNTIDGSNYSDYNSIKENVHIKLRYWMKVAIITDTHYGFKKGSKVFEEYFENFYRTVFFPTLEQYG